ncbi:MAG: response regulator transcription factor [Dehalococcoidia bacterium]
MPTKQYDRNRKRILVVDDNRRLLKLLHGELEAEGYDVETAAEGDGALKVIQADPPDLVVLDLMLPDTDGFDVCSKIKESLDVPVLILTARESDSDKVRGLDLGADDYLTKPFSMDEFLARVRSVLRRAGGSSSRTEPQSFRCCGITVNYDARTVTIEGEQVPVTPTEFFLLWELVTSADKILTHDELLTRVWGPASVHRVEYLWVNLSRLRQKLAKQASTYKDHIRSRPGIGYLFSCPVRT